MKVCIVIITSRKDIVLNTSKKNNTRSPNLKNLKIWKIYPKLRKKMDKLISIIKAEIYNNYFSVMIRYKND